MDSLCRVCGKARENIFHITGACTVLAPTMYLNSHHNQVVKIIYQEKMNLEKLIDPPDRKNDLILIMTPEKQDKTLELNKHWSADSTPARNEMIMKRTYPVKSVKCDKICSNY